MTTRQKAHFWGRWYVYHLWTDVQNCYRLQRKEISMDGQKYFLQLIKWWLELTDGCNFYCLLTEWIIYCLLTGRPPPPHNFWGHLNHFNSIFVLLTIEEQHNTSLVAWLKEFFYWRNFKHSDTSQLYFRSSI